MPAHSVRELVALIRNNPGKYSFASAGTGTQSHLAGAISPAVVGLDLVHVPFNGGAPATASVIAGHTPIGFTSPTAAMVQVKEGKLCAHAVTSTAAIANLVDNAVKFTPQGGRVEVSLHQTGHEAVVRVRDTGPGIAENDHDLVGRRFYRADKSRCQDGVGLGLSLVNAIVKLHGFRFNISAGPGCVAEIAGERATAFGKQDLVYLSGKERLSLSCRRDL